MATTNNKLTYAEICKNSLLNKNNKVSNTKVNKNIQIILNEDLFFIFSEFVDIKFFLDTSKTFQIWKKNNYKWKLNFTYSLLYCMYKNFKILLDSKISNIKQLFFDLSKNSHDKIKIGDNKYNCIQLISIKDYKIQSKKLISSGNLIYNKIESIKLISIEDYIKYNIASLKYYDCRYDYRYGDFYDFDNYDSDDAQFYKRYIYIQEKTINENNIDFNIHGCDASPFNTCYDLEDIYSHDDNLYYEDFYFYRTKKYIYFFPAIREYDINFYKQFESYNINILY